MKTDIRNRRQIRVKIYAPDSRNASAPPRRQLPPTDPATSAAGDKHIRFQTVFTEGYEKAAWLLD
jgi:hypothetical protein